MTISNEYADMCGTDKGSHQGFMPIYDRYLPNRWSAISLVELGVYRGDSIFMWDNFFPNQFTKIYGVDIDLSQVTQHFSDRVTLVEGDQAEWRIPARLADNDVEINARTKGYEYGHDVIIDDASHISSKTIGAFNVWWPYLKPGGIYIVEDTHCSYDIEFYGDNSAPPEYDAVRYSTMDKTVYTTMGYLKRLADDVNWNYHGYNRFTPLRQDVAFLHFYPGIAIIGKK